MSAIAPITRCHLLFFHLLYHSPVTQPIPDTVSCASASAHFDTPANNTKPGDTVGPLAHRNENTVSWRAPPCQRAQVRLEKQQRTAAIAMFRNRQHERKRVGVPVQHLNDVVARRAADGQQSAHFRYGHGNARSPPHMTAAHHIRQTLKGQVHEAFAGWWRSCLADDADV